MSRIEKLQRTFEESTADKFAHVVCYVHALEQSRWDAQMDQDAAAGRLDFLINEARGDQQAGLLKDSPLSDKGNIEASS